MQHDLLLDRALEGPVELLERLARGETGCADPRLATVGLARAALGSKERLGEALVAPFLCAGAFDELRQRTRRGRRLERAEEVTELGGRGHAGMSRSYALKGRRSTWGSAGSPRSSCKRRA